MDFSGNNYDIKNQESTGLLQLIHRIIQIEIP